MIRRFFQKLICKWRGHPKVITFWAKDFAYDEVCEWIKCECGDRQSFVKSWSKY